MTTLTATISNKFACLLAESQLTDDASHIRMQTECQKVFNIDSWVFSGSGWNRPGDILAYQMKWPVVPKTATHSEQSLTSWIVKNLVPKIEIALTKHKAIDYDKGTALQDSEFLISTYGRVWLLDEGFGITPIKDFYISGSGGKIALGAIGALRDMNRTYYDAHHDQVALQGIKQAIAFDLYSSGKVHGYCTYPTGEVKIHESVS
jgi:hypothetical protein